MNIGNAQRSMLCKREKRNKYYKAELHLTLNEENNSQATIANQVKENSVVLDVGCGAGTLGKLLKTEKGCRVYGIDIDKKALRFAKKKYDGVMDVSVSEPESRKYKKVMRSKRKYDVIIFADLLEHIQDPGRLLYDFSKKLSQGGKFLISIPNVAHWDIILGLLKNNFNYDTTGLLDTTHIRFYTYNSFLDLISNINEKYKTNLKARLIGTTKANPEASINDLTNMNKFFSEHLTNFQNIFEVSPTTIKDERTKLKDDQTFLEILEHENQYRYLIEDNKNKAKDIDTLTRECKELIEQQQKLETKLNQYELKYGELSEKSE